MVVLRDLPVEQDEAIRADAAMYNKDFMSLYIFFI